MACRKEEKLVYDVKLSSVGPGRCTGLDVVHEPSSMDLAMKLHYLKCVYFFSIQSAQKLTVMRIKETMFTWLNDYYITCGRFRRSESGRPYMKCNDCGIRFVEAKCDKTVEEWLEMGDDCLQNLLVYHTPIGPEITFSPSVYIQVTWFKCGGMSLGLSWAHVLGDAFSVSDWISMWGVSMAGLKPNVPPNFVKNEKFKNPQPIAKEPLSVKRVDPVGDHWVTASNSKMETFSFQVTATQMSHLQSKISGKNEIPSFESLCAIIWQCIAIVREGFEPKIVSICKKDPYRKSGTLSNGQTISVVQANFSIMDANLDKLATLLIDQATDERSKIEEAVERDDGLSDFIVYGSNLTFVDLEEANLYGLKMNGHKPEFVYYTIQGVGDEGAVLVLPGPKDSGKGRFVTVILPENQVLDLKSELKMNGLLLETDLE